MNKHSNSSTRASNQALSPEQQAHAISGLLWSHSEDIRARSNPSGATLYERIGLAAPRKQLEIGSTLLHAIDIAAKHPTSTAPDVSSADNAPRHSTKVKLDDLFSRVASDPDRIGVDFQHTVSVLQEQWPSVMDYLNRNLSKDDEATFEKDITSELTTKRTYRNNRQSDIGDDSAKKGVLPLLRRARHSSIASPEEWIIDQLTRCVNAAIEAWQPPQQGETWSRKSRDEEVFRKNGVAVADEARKKLVKMAKPSHVRHIGRPPKASS
jgi:hypothetical protein